MSTGSIVSICIALMVVASLTVKLVGTVLKEYNKAQYVLSCINIEKETDTSKAFCASILKTD